MDSVPQEDLLSAYSKNQLVSAGAWARILGIIGFVFSGLIVAMAIFMTTGGMGSMLEASGADSATLPLIGKSGMILGLLYLLIAGIYFLISWWTFKFGSEIRTGIVQNDPEEIGSAFNNLKNYFQAYGILTMIALGIMFLSFLSVMMVGFFN